MSINKAILIGNVGPDPTIRLLEREDKNNTVASFSLATTERGYTLANGTQVPERTEWHNIVAWKGLAEIVEKYVRKGSKVYIEGKITTRTWEKDGITRYNTQIVAERIDLLSPPPQRQDQEPAQAAGAPTGYTPKGLLASEANKSTEQQGDLYSEAPPAISKEDDLPF